MDVLGKPVEQNTEMKNSDELNKQAGLHYLNRLPDKEKTKFAGLQNYHFYTRLLSMIGELSTSNNKVEAENILETLLNSIKNPSLIEGALNAANESYLEAKEDASRNRDYHEGSVPNHFKDSFTPASKNRA